MNKMNKINKAKFDVGQQIQHRLFDYRGVIFDLDPVFMGSDEWYREMATSQPPKNAPWYHVLVHGTENRTYVAQQNLMAYDSKDEIEHPLLESLFDGFEQGRYRRRGVN